MNAPDLIPALLLMLLSLLLASGAAIVLLRARLLGGSPRPTAPEPAIRFNGSRRSAVQNFSHRPTTWIAVRSRKLMAVQAALGLSNPRPCTWLQGLAGESELFIAPPVHGWILVTGSTLPDPAEDVDATFRFILQLSRKLGHVQYFHANPVVSHHAWVRADSGRILRAYAWAGATLWNQGAPTQAESALAMKCFQYLESPDSSVDSPAEIFAANTDKVPQLAALWSIDPAAIDERALDHACGIEGEPPRSC